MTNTTAYNAHIAWRDKLIEELRQSLADERSASIRMSAEMLRLQNLVAAHEGMANRHRQMLDGVPAAMNYWDYADASLPIGVFNWLSAYGNWYKRRNEGTPSA